MTKITGKLHVKVRKAKTLKNSSGLWLSRHLNDPYARQSKIDGYRARSAYKLIEIADKYKIFKKNSVAVDLGSAPGGWSQVLSQSKIFSKIYAVDILPMDEVKGVNFIRADFVNEIDKIQAFVKECADLIVSDIAPNFCGDGATDHLRSISICYDVLDALTLFMKDGGTLVIKVIDGREAAGLLTGIKALFSKVNRFKPKASSDKSCEFYIIATGYRAN